MLTTLLSLGGGGGGGSGGDLHDGGGGHHGFFDGTGGLQTMGIINAMRTGDPWLDMILAMMIPVALRMAFALIGRLDQYLHIEQWKVWWYHISRRHLFRHERYIVYQAQRTSWGELQSTDNDSQNTVLLKAIQLYLHHKGNLHLPIANLDLTSTDDKKLASSSNSHYYDPYDEYGDQDDDDKTIVGQLSKFRIIKKPPQNRWHKLGKFGNPLAPVELRICKNEEEADGGGGGEQKKSSNTCTTTFHFISSGPNAIDSFIDTAYQWYLDELKKLEDNSRYLYELKSLRKGNDDDDDFHQSNNILYSRYRLSDEKTFKSLFFRQKDKLLNLIDHFQAKTGKYGISGYPHKFGLLLHGPPGTGKTSLIKSIATYTNRNIVNVPLTRITTNSELMDIFFEKKYRVRGEYVPVKLGFKDVIFVLEDVDAASKIVRRRDGKIPLPSSSSNDNHNRGLLTVPSADDDDSANDERRIRKSTWQMLVASDDPDCREVVKILMEKSERLRKATLESDLMETFVQRIGTGLSGCNATAPGDEEAYQLSIEQAMSMASATDRFIGVHARSIKALLDADAPISDSFVDKLLGVAEPIAPVSAATPPSNRAISYSQYDERADEALFGEANSKSMAMNDMMVVDEPKTTETGGGGNAGNGVMGPSIWKPKKDQLNLTGLLNVLDGIVDTPGRILIMTTNHPEYLDPALIRPGRIDKKIMLGYMCAEDVVGMLEHYFQTTLDSLQRDRVENIILGTPHYGLKLTPAQVEQMTAECDELEDMLSVLEARRTSLLSPSTPATTSCSASTVGSDET